MINIEVESNKVTIENRVYELNSSISIALMIEMILRRLHFSGETLCIEIVDPSGRIIVNKFNKNGDVG